MANIALQQAIMKVCIRPTNGMVKLKRKNANLRNRNSTDLPPRPTRRRAMPRQRRGTVSVVRL